MTIQHGFHAAFPAHRGQGDALVALLLAAPSLGNDDCVVFLVSRSASNPDLVFVAELAPLIAGESIYSDAIPVGGKAILA